MTPGRRGLPDDLAEVGSELLSLPNGTGVRLRSQLLAELEWRELCPEDDHLAEALTFIRQQLVSARRLGG